MILSLNKTYQNFRTIYQGTAKVEPFRFMHCLLHKLNARRPSREKKGGRLSQDGHEIPIYVVITTQLRGAVHRAF